MKKINKIYTKTIYDELPDTSFLGKYTDEVNDWYIDREQGEYIAILQKDEDYELPSKGREYRFFNPCAGGEEEGTEDYQKYGKQDFERMESLNNGNWFFMGIETIAEVHTSQDGKNWLINTLSSGGLWGIESDSDNSYIEEVNNEQINELKTVLKEYGFSTKEINKALKSIEHKDI
jgi:hypothetical protein